MHPRDKEVIRRYKAGETLADLSDAFGLSKSGIAVILERHKVKRRPKGAPLKLAGWEAR